MSAPAGPEMYSKLIDDDGLYDNFTGEQGPRASTGHDQSRVGLIRPESAAERTWPFPNPCSFTAPSLVGRSVEPAPPVAAGSIHWVNSTPLTRSSAPDNLNPKTLKVSVSPVSPSAVGLPPSQRRSGPSPGFSPGPSPGWSPGLYKAFTVALAALCVILLICVIAVSIRNQKNHASGGELIPQNEKHKQELNVTELLSTINRLKEENELLKAQLNSSKAVPTIAPLQCPANWLPFSGSCYFISTQSRSWRQSKVYCESQGAHLAIIHTAEEQTFLWDLLPRGYWNCFWFGITDSHIEDQWKWVDGTPLVGGFWEEGEPNNHVDEDCGYILKTDVLTRVAIRSWYDAPCSMSLPFICEMEGPRPTTKRPN